MCGKQRKTISKTGTHSHMRKLMLVPICLILFNIRSAIYSVAVSLQKQRKFAPHTIPLRFGTHTKTHRLCPSPCLPTGPGLKQKAGWGFEETASHRLLQGLAWTVGPSGHKGNIGVKGPWQAAWTLEAC